jgi:hypothetical protein
MSVVRYRHEVTERFGVHYRQVCEHLAVDLHPFALQARNELAVARSVLARSGIDPLYPEPTEVTFTRPTVAVGVLQ